MSAGEQRALGTAFGARAEPHEVLAGVDLTGRRAIVTGGYSGIGLETTRALVAAGARVTVPARRPEVARDALADIEGVELASLDLGDLASVRAFASAASEHPEPVDLLVANAGVMACEEARVGPGWESQFGINHMGHFALVSALLPKLRAARAPRVVVLSSSGHRVADVRWDDLHFAKGPYDKWAAYGQAKTANALFARALDARLREDGGRAFSVYPGAIFTGLQRHLRREEMQALGWLDENGDLSAAARAGFRSPTQGAATTLWAATAAVLDDEGGQYCEDCDIAKAVAADDAGFSGVRPWAMDDEAAERLWTLSEALLADT